LTIGKKGIHRPTPAIAAIILVVLIIDHGCRRARNGSPRRPGTAARSPIFVDR
jgi:hypothetical protein